MHIEKLKYYIDLCECWNFTETARKNYITQAALSQFIRSLEKQFDLQFFDRSVTPIEPTAAGTSFYEEIRLTKIRLNESEDYLTKELCDLVVSFSTEFLDKKKIRYKVLREGNYHAVVAKGHDLFDRDSITNEELYRYPLIMLNQGAIGDLYDIMRERVRADGYEPIIEKTVDDIDTEMVLIITEGYIGFAPDSQNLSNYGDALRLIPIIGSGHTYMVAAAYSKENKCPA